VVSDGELTGGSVTVSIKEGEDVGRGAREKEATLTKQDGVFGDGLTAYVVQGVNVPVASWKVSTSSEDGKEGGKIEAKRVWMLVRYVLA
jgi:hypothetical protein